MTIATPPRGALTVDEAAEALRVSPRTCWRLVANGALKSARVGRRVVVLAASVDEFLERGGAVDLDAPQPGPGRVDFRTKG